MHGSTAHLPTASFADIQPSGDRFERSFTKTGVYEEARGEPPEILTKEQE
jgi:hypothetical protein